MQGTAIGEFREQDQTIPILLRGAEEERNALSQLAGLNVTTSSGKTVPLSQLSKIEYVQEDGVRHRNRVRTITVRAAIFTAKSKPNRYRRSRSTVANPARTIASGYRLETGGAVEESAKGNESIGAGFPLFIVVVLMLLMIQLQSFQRVIMVVLTAPFGLIGVVLFLLLFDRPFGFVAMLGTIALSGMIMRNSVILVDQIERNLSDGQSFNDAVVEAAVRRFRPDYAHGVGGNFSDDSFVKKRIFRANGGGD